MVKPDVLVFPRSVLDGLGDFQGLKLFSGEPERLAWMSEIMGSSRFIPRENAESDESMKQIIPYAVFTNGPFIFRYTRGKSGEEGRLHRKHSIGFGGHINPCDEKSDEEGRSSILTAALSRELAEEVILGSAMQIGQVGLVNDDSEPVGRVHLGVVFLMDLQYPLIRTRGEEHQDGLFFDIQCLLSQRNGLEVWSKHVLDWLISLATEIPSGPKISKPGLFVPPERKPIIVTGQGPRTPH